MRCVLSIEQPSELFLLFYKYIFYIGLSFLNNTAPSYTTVLIRFYNRRVKKFVFDTVCVSRLRSITQLLCNNNRCVNIFISR